MTPISFLNKVRRKNKISILFFKNLSLRGFLKNNSPIYFFSFTKSEKKLLQIAFSTIIIQGLQLPLVAQKKLPMPVPSAPEQLLHTYQSKINTGELVMDLVVEDQVVIPTKSFILFQNHPNPFTKETTIQFELLHSTSLSLTIYNPAGEVLKVYDGYFEKGRNQIQVDGKDLKEYGVLYYQMTTKSQILSKKMIFKKADDISSSANSSSNSTRTPTSSF